MSEIWKEVLLNKFDFEFARNNYDAGYAPSIDELRSSALRAMNDYGRSLCTSEISIDACKYIYFYLSSTGEATLSFRSLDESKNYSCTVRVCDGFHLNAIATPPAKIPAEGPEAYHAKHYYELELWCDGDDITTPPTKKISVRKGFPLKMVFDGKEMINTYNGTKPEVGQVWRDTKNKVHWEIVAMGDGDFCAMHYTQNGNMRRAMAIFNSHTMKNGNDKIHLSEYCGMKDGERQCD